MIRKPSPSLLTSVCRHFEILEQITRIFFSLLFCMCSVYKGAAKDHVITNVAGGKTITLTKSNFPDTGKGVARPMLHPTDL